MSTPIDEGAVRFTFGDEWEVEKYDETGVYRTGLGKLDGSKAVDMVGIHAGRDIYLIELKDMRTYRIENKGRVGEPLALEVAQKVRDTLAGVSGAARKGLLGIWKPVARKIPEGKSCVKVVLSLDQDRAPSPFAEQKGKADLLVLTRKLEQKCAWLDCRVLATNAADAASKIPDLTIQNLPRGTGQ